MQAILLRAELMQADSQLEIGSSKTANFVQPSASLVCYYKKQIQFEIFKSLEKCPEQEVRTHPSARTSRNGWSQRFQIEAACHATTARRRQFHQWCSKRHTHVSIGHRHRIRVLQRTATSTIDNQETINRWENRQYMYEYYALHALLFCYNRYNYVTYCGAI